MNSNKDYIYLNTFLNEWYLENIDSIIDYFKKVHNKQLSINEFLLVIKRIWQDYINVEKILLLNKYVEDFDSNDLIQLNWNKVNISGFDFLNNIKNNINNFSYDLEKSLKYFDNFTKEKLIAYLEFVQKTDTFCERPWDNYYRDKRKLDYVIWEKYAYNDKDYINSNPMISYRINNYLIQEAINSGDFSNLEIQIKASMEIVEYRNGNDFNFKEIKEKLEEVLQLIDWYLSKQLLEIFVVWVNQFDIWENSFDLKKSIKNIKDYTWIELTWEDLKDKNILDLIKELELWLINNETNLIDFFKLCPIFEKEGRYWDSVDIKEWWELYLIVKNIYLSVRLVNEQSFSLDDLIELYSKEINLTIISEKLDKILWYTQWFYYWYFVESINFKSNWWEKVEIDDNYPVNYENFLDFMWDDEILLDYNQEWLKVDWIKPFSKAWFLEKPERKEYLKNIHNYNIFPKTEWNLVESYIYYNVESFDALCSFINSYILKSKNNKRVWDTFINNKIWINWKQLFIFLNYFLHNKRKKLISMIQNILFSFSNNIWINNFTIKNLAFCEPKENYITFLNECLKNLWKTEKEKNKIFKQTENAFKRKQYESVDKILIEYQIELICKK